MAKYYLSFWIIILTVSGLNAQPRVIDSLKSRLQEKLSEQERVDVLNELSYTLYDTDDSAAFHYAQLGLAAARKANDQLGERYAHTLMGLGYFNTSQYAKGLVSLRESAKIKRDEKKELVGYNIMLMGSIYRELGHYDSAQYFFQLAISTIGEDGDGYYLAAAYNNLANLLVAQWKNKEAIEILDKAEPIALRNVKDKYVLITIWTTYMAAYKNLLDYPKASYYIDKMCEESTQSIYYYNIINCYLSRADLAYKQGEFAASLQHSFDALKVSEIYTYPPLRASVYMKIGDVYEEYSQYELAFKYFLDALKVTEKYGLRDETAKIYAELGWISKDQLNYKQAHEYLDRAEAIYNDIGDQAGLSTCYNYRGLLYYQEKNYDQALEELDKSLRIREANGNKIGEAACLYNLALVYEGQSKLDQALQLQLKGIDIEESIGNIQGLSISFSGIAALYMKLGNLVEAEKFLEKSMKLVEQTHSRSIERSVHGSYVELYTLNGNYKAAYEHQKIFQQLSDSIYSEGSAVKISEMQALYQVEKKEQEIQLLNQEKQIKDDELILQRTRIRTQNIIIFSIILSFLLVSLLAVKSYQFSRKIHKAHHEILEQKEEIQAQSEELIEANQTISQINKSLEAKIDDRTSALKQAYKELDTFFYRSSHDFRRPLTTFLGLAEVAKVTVKDPNALELFGMVKETASNLDKMLTKLTSISDVGVQDLVYKEVMVKEIFDTVCDGFKEQLEKHKIKTSCAVNLNEPLMSYPAMIKLIIENLVENSLLFCGFDSPFIELNVFEDGESVVMEVKDNGQGINPQYEDRVFEMYFRGTERSKGNGLGLYIVKKAVGKLHGQISFSSLFGHGTVFRVTLPRNYDR